MEVTGNFQNLSLSVLSFVAAESLSRFVNFKSKYVRRFIKPVAIISLHFLSSSYLSQVNVTGSGLLAYVANSFIGCYRTYHILSMITFVIGFPVIHVLFGVLESHVVDFINKYKQESLEIIDAANKFRVALANNDNWDIIYGDFSLKTGKKIVMMSVDELNDKLPLRSKANENASTSFYDTECAVCLENIDNVKLHRELMCRHTFHPECVDSWLLNGNSNCPKCRSNAY